MIETLCLVTAALPSVTEIRPSLSLAPTRRGSSSGAVGCVGCRPSALVLGRQPLGALPRTGMWSTSIC